MIEFALILCLLLLLLMAYEVIQHRRTIERLTGDMVSLKRMKFCKATPEDIVRLEKDGIPWGRDEASDE